MSRKEFIASMVPPEIDPAASLSLDTFKELFPSEDTLISFSDFVLFDALSSTNEKTLMTSFRMFDKDGDGLLSKGNNQPQVLRCE